MISSFMQFYSLVLQFNTQTMAAVANTDTCYTPELQLQMEVDQLRYNLQSRLQPTCQTTVELL